MLQIPLKEDERKEVAMLVLKAASAYLIVVAEDRNGAQNDVDEAWEEVKNVIYLFRAPINKNEV